MLTCMLIKGNDIETEGYYENDDGTEIQWVSNWYQMGGTNSDTLVMGTWNNANAGSWSDAIETYNYRYICECHEDMTHTCP